MHCFAARISPPFDRRSRRRAVFSTLPPLGQGFRRRRPHRRALQWCWCYRVAENRQPPPPAFHFPNIT